MSSEQSSETFIKYIQGDSLLGNHEELFINYEKKKWRVCTFLYVNIPVIQKILKVNLRLPGHMC
jgi:hypothetical protein